MFTHKRLVRQDSHIVRGTEFELLVFQIEETREYEINISKCGMKIGDYLSVSQELIDDSKSDNAPDFSIERLLEIAKGEIDQNQFGKYD